ncbi:MAG: bifunctional folylpolyglutamate synthase/dihydrofolate synthase [Syntrophus sp. (in: bacteria)]|nr:bifunctional folylpolyglutamate synthase/dihydrofolate synthase [Syntrophus sp. (in: bacteria)]
MKGYADTLEYLYGLERFGIVFGLENIEWILNSIGNPQRFIKTVHIGGTNGKGSTASMLSSMLQEAGYKVGKYTSPHLLSFTERIVVNEAAIEEEEIVLLAEKIKANIEAIDEKRFFTFFDFTSALAFEYFFRKEVDIAIIEVGLGGRLDSTNVIEPLVSIITNVDYDHMDYLGGAIQDIAREKAGIIKEMIPVITGAEGLPMGIVDDIAKAKKSLVYALNRDFFYEKEMDQRMSYRGIGMRLDDVFVSLRGDHQFANSAIALCAAEYLSSAGFPLEEESMRKGLSRTEWPGRLEIVRERPTILIDGAHNPHGVRALSEYIKSHYKDKRKILVFGVMKDKDYEVMLKELLPLIDAVILTKPGIERGLLPQCLEKYREGAIVSETIEGALREARRIAREEDLILITGSLYTIGEAKSIIEDIF